MVEIFSVKVDNPAEYNIIFGQSHFIKTVEDVHEALVNTVPGIKFGVAFCEASAKCLVRWSGTDDEMVELAKKNANEVGCGHTFFIFLREAFPINVLKAVQAVPEVCSIFCATANPLEVVIADNGTGRGVLGVIDGAKPAGMEGDEDREWRVKFLRDIGYKAR
jgi:hypothetical protein